MRLGKTSSRRSILRHADFRIQVPVAWLIAVAPHAIASATYNKYDIRAPRKMSKDVEEDQSIDQAVSRHFVSRNPN